MIGNVCTTGGHFRPTGQAEAADHEAIGQRSRQTKDDDGRLVW